MRFSSLLLVAVTLFGGTNVLADPPQRHNFANLQRLAVALKSFNHPENSTARITVWRQKNISVTIGDKTVDLTRAMRSFADKGKGFDLANVAVISKGGRAIRFVDMRKYVESGKPSGVKLKRGDLVVILRPMAK